jgi:hypothetical protein
VLLKTKTIPFWVRTHDFRRVDLVAYPVVAFPTIFISKFGGRGEGGRQVGYSAFLGKRNKKKAQNERKIQKDVCR